MQSFRPRIIVPTHWLPTTTRPTTATRSEFNLFLLVRKLEEKTGLISFTDLLTKLLGSIIIVKSYIVCLMFQENEEDGLSMTDRQRRKQTANILLNNKAGDSRILSFKTKAPAADDAHVNSLKVSTYNFTDFMSIFL